MYLFGDDEGPAETMKDVEYGTDDWDYWKEAAGWEEVFTFDLVAVTTDQIEAWDLPTRPTKRSDSRSKKFRGASVELDAIAPAQLRELCEEVILRHIDHDQIDVLKVAEESEREVLTKVANREVA
jgi:hypothetical protein